MQIGVSLPLCVLCALCGQSAPRVLTRGRVSMNTWYALESTAPGETTVTLYDEIGAFGLGSKQFLSDIGKLDGQHIHLRINSPGGSVIEGTAIYNALRRHTGGLTVHIDALAASMASVIAMSGAPVYIADNALLMIHNPWTVSMGDSDQLRKEADLLDKLKSTLVNAYVRKTGMDQAQVSEMMDAETWLDATEAVALGFADGIEEGVAAAAIATPENLRARFDTFAKGMSQKTEPTDSVVTESEPIAPAEVAPEISPETAAEPAVESTPAPAAAPAPETMPQDGEAVNSGGSYPPVAGSTPAPAMADRMTSVDAILAKFNEVSAERDALRSEISAIRAKLDLTSSELATKTEDLGRLERSLGLAAARVVPEINPAENPASIYDQWKNATGAEKTRIFRANRKALEAHAKASAI